MIPISLFIILVISNRGPWNAFSVSMRSQLTRVESILQKNNMLIDGKAVAAKNQISAKDEFELTTILNYLIQQHTFHSLDGLFPSHLLEKKQSENEFSDSYLFSKNQNSSELMKYLGLNYRSYLNDLRSVSFSHSLTYSNAGVNLAGYKYMFVVGNYDEEIILDGKKLKLLFNDEHLNVYENDKIVQKISFIDFASKLFAENNSDMYRSLTQDKMEIPVKIDKAEALLLLTNVSGTKKDDKIEITTISGYLFVK